MSFKSFLSAVGHDAAKVFTFLGSTQGQATIAGVEADANVVATAVNPALGVALPAIETLFNNGLKQVLSVETVAAAAGQESGTGAQKAAAVATAVAPNVAALLQSLGVAAPTSAQVQTIATALSTGIVTVLNSIPAPAAA